MKKYNLTSDLGYFFVLTSNLMGIGIIGFFIYSLFTLNTVASLLCFAIGFSYFMLYYRHTRKFVNVYFDERYLYYQQALPLEKIVEIGKKKIVVCNDKGTYESLYFNYFFSNINLLKKFINPATPST